MLAVTGIHDGHIAPRTTYAHNGVVDRAGSDPTMDPAIVQASAGRGRGGAVEELWLGNVLMVQLQRSSVRADAIAPVVWSNLSSHDIRRS